MGNFTLKPYLHTNFFGLQYFFIAALFSLVGFNSFGQGVYLGKVFMKVNADATTFRRILDAGVCNDEQGYFSGNNYGTYSSTSIITIGGTLLGYGGLDSGNTKMYYKIYNTPAGAASVSWQSVNLPSISAPCNNGSDQRFEQAVLVSASTNFTVSGGYTIAVYYEAKKGGTTYNLGTSGSPYTATITLDAPSISGAKLGVNFNSGGTIWRYTGAQDACDGGSLVWPATNLGTLYTSGSIVIVGANLVATTGSSSPQLFYRVYKQGDVPPSFTSANLTTTTAVCGSSTKYESSGLNITISSASYNVAGTYSFEVYHQASNGSTINMGTSGSPYVATFVVTAITSPSVTVTDAATTITSISATSGGNITNDGGSSIIERGIVYSTTASPTTLDTKLTIAGTTGTFTANLAGLTPLTTYYVRAYAINGIGTSYGPEISFTSANPTYSGKVFFKLNGGGTQYYGCSLNTVCDPGQTSDLDSGVPIVGTISQGQTFQIGGNIIQSGTVYTGATMYYQVYKSGNTAPGYIAKVLTNIGAPGNGCNAADRKWEISELLTTITAGYNSAGTLEGDGTYIVQLYFSGVSGITYDWKKLGIAPFSAKFDVITMTPVGDRDPNDANYDPTVTDGSGMFESYMGVLVKDISGTPITGLNRVFDMDGALGSTNSSNFDFGTQDPGLTFNVGTETKVFTKGTHKVCGCSSWSYVYNAATTLDPVATDFPLPSSGSLFSLQTNGKFTLLNSSLSINSNQPFTIIAGANASGSTSNGGYNSSIDAGTITKFKDYTDPTTGTVDSINAPVNSILCPTCSGDYRVAIAMLAWVSTNNNCSDASSYIYHRDINKNKVTNAGVVLNPNHNDAPQASPGNSSKNSLPGTSLFYVSKVKIGASDGLKKWDGFNWRKPPIWALTTPPTKNNDVQFSGNYSTASGDIECNDMSVDNGVVVTIEEDDYIEALNTVTTNTSGKIIIKNTGNLVQRCDEKPELAYIEHLKTTGLKRKWDYVYWGTPINENILGTKPSPYDIGYWRQSGPGGGWRTLTSGDMQVGKGFILRIGNVAPWNAGAGANTSWQINGTANNGIVSIPVTQENYATNPTNYNNGALLANPYPCAIDGYKFLTDPSNLNLEGNLFFWTSATQYPGSGAYQDPDYAIWNLTGSTTPANGQTPNGKIPSGQGFFVRVMTNGTAVFKDYMRATDKNTMFFRKSNTDIDRYWINLTDGVSQNSQILIGHLEGATNDIDRMYDARKMGETAIELYSLFKKERLSINGRTPFNSIDEIPLGVSKKVNGPEIFTISLSNKEGIFANGTSIYLHDKKHNYYHDLQSGPYTFKMSNHEENNRFKIVYQQNRMLAISDFDNTAATAYIKDQKINIVSNDGIKKVTVFDIFGRVIVDFNTVKFEKTVTSDFNYSKGVYVTKIELENGKVVSQKIMN